MTPQEIYDQIEAFTPIQRRNFLKGRTDEERAAYKRFMNVRNQMKYRTNQENKAKYNERQVKIMAKVRDEDRVADRKKQQIYNKTYREKRKTKDLLQNQNVDKAKSVIGSAIRAHKARNELKELKEKQSINTYKKMLANQQANDLVNDVMANVPKIVKKIENKQSVYRTRLRAKLEKEGKDIPEELKPKRKGRKPKS